MLIMLKTIFLDSSFYLISCGTIFLSIVRGQGHPEYKAIPLSKSLAGSCAPYSITLFMLSGVFENCEDTVRASLTRRHPDQNKNTPQILETYGYPYETHYVTTQDNYILTVYRVTGSPNRNPFVSTKPKYPVYLQHGIGAASDCWNFQPGNRNLLFKLADAGYDVWLGNARGTSYSLGHKFYNADRDLKYWDFSHHEMGVYDIPAVTQKILSTSETQQLIYIGHSLGTSMLFVALSQLPQMNQKIRAAFLLSPVAYQGHSYNPIRIFSSLSLSAPLAVNLAVKGRVAWSHPSLAKLGISWENICASTAAQCGLCDNLLFMMLGYNAPQMNTTELPNIVAKLVNSASLKTWAHNGQAVTSCKFRQYDYGTVGNLKTYGRTQPPDYKLENIRAPLYFYIGERDNIVSPWDVNKTISQLYPGVLQDVYKINDPLFNHNDFIAAKDADILLYNRILNQMAQL